MSHKQHGPAGRTVHERPNVDKRPEFFSPQDEARKVFPTLSDRDITSIMWEHTGFPGFWDLRDGESNSDCFVRQLIQYRNSECQGGDS